MEKRILLIDDDFSLRKVISRALSSSKISVKNVSTLSEAWVTIEKNDFDLIICDVMLPDGELFDILPQITELREDLPVIVVSAKNNLQTAISATKQGAYEYLPKPFDLDELQNLVKKALERKKTTKR